LASFSKSSQVVKCRRAPEFWSKIKLHGTLSNSRHAPSYRWVRPRSFASLDAKLLGSFAQFSCVPNPRLLGSREYAGYETGRRVRSRSFARFDARLLGSFAQFSRVANPRLAWFSRIWWLCDGQSGSFAQFRQFQGDALAFVHALCWLRRMAPG
jgi:hypothetical protein